MSCIFMVHLRQGIEKGTDESHEVEMQNVKSAVKASEVFLKTVEEVVGQHAVRSGAISSIICCIWV